MTHRPTYLLAGVPLAVLAAALGLTPAPLAAQIPGQPVGVGQPQPVDANPDDGADVLARGPVHEAYATTYEQPNPDAHVAPKAPPDPIDELPPDQKPEGDNVQWIPGYWHWDEERTDFIWVSGFWRVPPPNRVWVPGSWRATTGGWQWVSGFWQQTVPDQPAQPELEYLPQPPQPLEAGPTIPAPAATSVYIPGSWVWRSRYFWRPGVWVDYRPGWLWVPAHFRWTPIGYVFVEGYWDYPPASRGVIFAPVYYSRRVYAQPGYVYTPTYVVAEPVLVGALFVRRGWNSYYFGNYFEPRYAQIGYAPWCRPALPAGGFAVGVNAGPRWHYDPLWSYYSASHRQNPAWNTGVTTLYVGRYQGTVARPPVTLAQQNTVIRNVTRVNNVNNVTNNITVVNNNLTVNNTNVTNNVMVTPLRTTPQLQPDANLQPITADVRRQEAVVAKDIRQVAVQRAKVEESLRDKAPIQPKANPGRHAAAGRGPDHGPAGGAQGGRRPGPGAGRGQGPAAPGNQADDDADRGSEDRPEGDRPEDPGADAQG